MSLESPHFRPSYRLVAAAVGAVSCLLIISGILALQSIRRMKSDAAMAMAADSHHVRSAIDRLELTVNESQAEQQDFLNTGDEADITRDNRERILLHLADVRAAEAQLLEKRSVASDQASQIVALGILVLTLTGLLLAGLVLVFRHVAQRRSAEQGILETARFLRSAADETLHRQTQRELAERVAQVSELARPGNEFLANLAHELRNPLAPITNALQLMGLWKLDPQIEALRLMMCRQAATLVRLIDDLQGGTLPAESTCPENEIVVNERHPAVDATGPESSSQTPPKLPSKPVRSFRVLVVEDMRASGELMVRLLARLGHEVEFAESGDLALQRLDLYPAEVIFSDITMPGMTGYELARRIRQRANSEDIHLVALTGFGGPADRVRALEAGFNEHMVKPVDIVVLQALFAKLAAS